MFQKGHVSLKIGPELIYAFFASAYLLLADACSETGFDDLMEYEIMTAVI